MDNILIWNDLPLYYPLSEKVVRSVDVIFQYAGSRCRCTYIPYDDAVKWAVTRGRDSITIGSRPGLLFGTEYNVKTVREKNTNGYASRTYLCEDSVPVLRRYVEGHRATIDICDDAIVEGNTLRAVVTAIRELTDAPIRIHVLSAVESAAEQLVSKFESVSLEAAYTVPGSPITACTILFVSDLIGEDPHFRMPFIRNQKLMRPCFYEQYERIEQALYALAREELRLPYYRWMNRETLFVTDLDGTLIENGQISEVVYATWKKMIDGLVPVTVATSRSQSGMDRALRGAVPLLPTIHYNGALIRDGHSGRIFWSCAFAPETGSMILRHGAAVQAAVLCIRRVGDDDRGFIVIFENGETSRRIPDRYANECARITFREILCANDIIAIYEYTEAPPAVGDFQVYRAEAFYQYTPAGADKGHAVALLAERLGFRSIVAFGDEENDLSLWQVADRFYSRSRRISQRDDGVLAAADLAAAEDVIGTIKKENNICESL